MQIIGVCGYIGSGKDTLADILIKERGYIKLSFASALKDAVSAIFGWDRNMLEGATSESRLLREQVDEWWSQRLNIPALTPRWILQNLGTDILRDKFHPDIWLASLERKIIGLSKNNIVITDCRFDNEYQVLKRLGAKIVRIDRHCTISSINHSSENSWQNFAFDFIIENNSTLDDLREKVLNAI
jgi:dephospho-CoA kinase